MSKIGRLITVALAACLLASCNKIVTLQPVASRFFFQNTENSDFGVPCQLNTTGVGDPGFSQPTADATGQTSQSTLVGFFNTSGQSCTIGGNWYYHSAYRGVVKFDLSQVPQGAKILSAILTFAIAPGSPTVTDSGSTAGAQNCTVGIGQTLVDWTPPFTAPQNANLSDFLPLRNFSSNAFWALGSGVNSVATGSDGTFGNVVVKGASGPVPTLQFNVASAVQSWVSKGPDAVQNNGFIFVGSDETLKGSNSCFGWYDDFSLEIGFQPP